MSAGVELWNREVDSSHGGAPARSGAAPAIQNDRDPIRILARQLFFCDKPPQRKRILFASVDSEVDVVPICEEIALAVSELSSGTAAVVESGAPLSDDCVTPDHPELKPHCVQLADRVWRVPSVAVSATFQDLPFDHVLLAASTLEGSAGWLQTFCTGAVLVIAANRTRRESAAHARDLLRQWHIELIGAVLAEREFPIPESIYRRL